MVKKKGIMPKFKTEEEEAEYWDSHSPLDVVADTKSQKVRIKEVKDNPITIRLDSQSRSKLERMADKQGIGPSTLSRLVIGAAISGWEKQTKAFNAIEDAHDLEASQQQSIAVIPGTEDVVKKDIVRARLMLKNALHRTLEGDWHTAISLSQVAKSIVPEKYFEIVINEVAMVWSCIQKTCITPLIDKAEKSISEWDYGRASEELDTIAKICEASRLPLDYADISIRIAQIAVSCCSVADRWKEDVYKKLDQTMIGVGVIKATIEEEIAIKVEEKRAYPLWR